MSPPCDFLGSNLAASASPFPPHSGLRLVSTSHYAPLARLPLVDATTHHSPQTHDHTHMCSDMRRDIQDIFRATPHQKQVMMFSATLAQEVRATCKKFMQNVRTRYLTSYGFFLLARERRIELIATLYGFTRTAARDLRRRREEAHPPRSATTLCPPRRVGQEPQAQ